MQPKKTTISQLFFLTIVLIASIYPGKSCLAQGQFTNMGKDFLLAFSSNNSNADSNSGLYLALNIVAPKQTHVKITYLFDDAIEEFDIPANTVRLYTLDATARAKVYSTSDGADKRTMRIEADNGVTIYAINMYQNTTDGTAVLPINNYGKEYINVGVPSSGCMIIAVEDGTTVQIDGVTIATLNKFQTYRRSTSSVGQKIVANKEIAVFNTQTCSNWPSGACDHQWEQLVPIANFGKEFFIPKTTMSSESIRIVAENPTSISYRIGTGSTQNTTVDATNATPENRIRTIAFTADMYLTADKPIGVTTHIGGKQPIPGQSDGGDPSTAWVPSIEQDITSAYITPFRGGNSVIQADYALVVAKTISKVETKINDANPVGTWRDHSSGFSSIIINLPSQIAYTILNPKGMIVLAYGVGGSESYYYLAASSARKLDASFTINGMHYQDANVVVPFDCGTPFNFAATIQYDLATADGRIRWFVDGEEELAVRNMLTWTKSYLPGGNHKVELWITDSHGEVEKLETTLNVACATDMTPKVATVYEGDQVKMTIALGAGSTPVALTFSLSAAAGTTAAVADYEFPSSVTITAGQSLVEFYVTATANNVINEPDKLLKLKASTIGYPDLTADITIKDRATAAQTELSLTATNATINEPCIEQPTTPNATTIRASLPAGVSSKTAIRVALNYAGSTATSNDDYTLSPASAISYIDIPADSNMGSYTLTAKEDLLVEGDESVRIVGTAPAGFTMREGESELSITIKDYTLGDIVVEKHTPTVGNASEPATNGSFRVRFGKANVTCTKPVKVAFSLSGEAVGGVDYGQVVPMEATIPAGQQYVDIPITVKNNFIVQGKRDVVVTINSAIPE